MPTKQKRWKIEIEATEDTYWKPELYQGHREERAASVHVAVYRALRDFKAATIPARTRIREYSIKITDLGGFL